jgi:integrase
VHAIVGGDTHVRKSLKTDDLAVARVKRDELEEADDRLWEALALGKPTADAKAAYEASVATALALRFAYKPAVDVAAGPMQDLLARIAAVPEAGASRPIADATLGLHLAPKVSVSDAFEVYVDVIATDELRGKSAKQRADWRKVKERARNNFIKVVGDVPLSDITRDQALQFYDFWRKRIAPSDKEMAEGALVTHSPASGNRDIGNMRVLFSAYHRHIGEMDRFNPFAGLGFEEDDERTRPPFSVKWITETILAPGALSTLNDPARRIFLTLVETGARPSEVANLLPRHIVLDHEIPHIVISPRREREDPRQIKTGTSVRKVPLLGVSLAAMKASPKGFPEYHDNETTLSNTLMKHFRKHKLLPTPAHTIYSIRHAFEDRMKDALVDEEVRKLLMGHALDRPRYGAGGSLELRREALARITLPFDKSIV